jgi:3-deoxy-7-phosphoheptulonate synthase
MIATMHQDATSSDIGLVVSTIAAGGGQAHLTRDPSGVRIAATGEQLRIVPEMLERLPGVVAVAAVAEPYELASKLFRPTESVLNVAGRRIGGSNFTLIAGPCTVEDHDQTLACAQAVAAGGAGFLRGGAFKPRTSPYSFQGHGEHALSLLADVKASTGMPIVTEVTDPRQIEQALEVADVVQVGARNMHNYALLTELGRTNTAVLLKRGLASTIDELLLAAEYVLSEGNQQVMLCERGIRTFEGAYRFTLDVGAIAVLKERTHLPVIVDPSHAAGRRSLVEPLSMAAVACGADGLIVEVHPQPDRALCDGPQAIPLHDFGRYAARVSAGAALAGKHIPATRPARRTRIPELARTVA